MQTITNDNCTQEEIKSRLNSGMDVTVQLKIVCFLMAYPKFYNQFLRSKILPVLCEHEIWSLALCEEYRLRLLRRTFGSLGGETAGVTEW